MALSGQWRTDSFTIFNILGVFLREGLDGLDEAKLLNMVDVRCRPGTGPTVPLSAGTGSYRTIAGITHSGDGNGIMDQETTVAHGDLH